MTAGMKEYAGVARAPFLLLPPTLVAAGAAASAWDGGFSWSTPVMPIPTPRTFLNSAIILGFRKPAKIFSGDDPPSDWPPSTASGFSRGVPSSMSRIVWLPNSI